MNRIIIIFLALALNCTSSSGEAFYKPDSLPSVLPENHSDLLENRLRFEGMMKFAGHQLPGTLDEWKIVRKHLRDEIISSTGITFNHDLPLDMKVTGSETMKGYTVKNIYFQTRPGVYATASLFVPDGKGPFPAVVNMLGHWRKAKIDSTGPQAVGHSLASNGYVCLTIDPWGSGERTTVHGIFEDHGDGNNLGSSLFNIGESLMGIEVSDNIRAVDLLCSLPYVDKNKIGATGASGGGNQTMWLAAMDDRVTAAVPVVSVGTFNSYIMGTPCICEVIPDALAITEEAGILALVAPRAIKMCNHNKDANPAFFPSEMIRSYNNARPVFKMLGVENNISYQLFDLPHGYMREDREALLGWLDLHLKGIGNGSARKEVPFQQLPEAKLMVFETGKRSPLIKTTGEYCMEKGYELKKSNLEKNSVDVSGKKKELEKILHLDEQDNLLRVHRFSKQEGWERVALETSDRKLIPVLIRTPKGNNAEYVIICDPEGKNNISSELINNLIKSGSGIAIADLSGTGEAAFKTESINYSKGKLRVLARSQMWLGKTILGEWVKELVIVSSFLSNDYKAETINLDGSKEAGLAGLFYGALSGNANSITVRNSPVSFMFDDRENVDFYSSAVFLMGIINWGDISLAAALAGSNIEFIGPRTISGRKINEKELKECKSEFEKIRSISKQKGQTIFR